MDWHNIATAERGDLLERSTLGFQRHDWHGMSLYYHAAVRRDLDLPEGFLLNHAIVWRMRGMPMPSEIRIGGSKWQRGAGAPLACFPASMPYAVRTRGSSEAVLLELTPGFVNACCGSRAVLDLHFLSLDDRLIVQLLHALVDDARSHSAAGLLYGESLGVALVARLLKMQGLRGDIADGDSPRTSLRLRRVSEYIQDNLAKDLSVSSLAQVGEMSIGTLVRRFKDSTGLPLHQYVLHARIDRAKALLATRLLSVADISLRTGFADQSHFSKTFRRMTGTSPRSYRSGVL